MKPGFLLTYFSNSYFLANQLLIIVSNTFFRLISDKLWAPCWKSRFLLNQSSSLILGDRDGSPRTNQKIQSQPFRSLTLSNTTRQFQKSRGRFLFIATVCHWINIKRGEFDRNSVNEGLKGLLWGKSARTATGVTKLDM